MLVLRAESHAESWPTVAAGPAETMDVRFPIWREVEIDDAGALLDVHATWVIY